MQGKPRSPSMDASAETNPVAAAATATQGEIQQPVERRQANYLTLRSRFINALIKDLNSFLPRIDRSSTDYAEGTRLLAFLEECRDDADVLSSTILDKITRVINDTMEKDKRSAGMMSTEIFSKHSQLGLFLLKTLEDFSYTKFESARQRDWDKLVTEVTFGASSSHNNKTIFNLNEEIAILRATINELTTAEEKLKLQHEHKLQLLQLKVDSNATELTRLLDENTELKKQFKSQKADLAESYQTLKEDLDDSNKRLLVANGKLSAAQDELDLAQDELSAKKSVIKAFEKDLAALKEKADRAEALQLENVKLESKQQFSEQTNAELRSQIAALRKNIEKLEAQLDAKEDALNKKEQLLGRNLDLMTSRLEEVSTFMNDSRAAWANVSGAGGLNGSFYPLGQRGDAPKQPVAVVAALAPRSVQNIPPPSTKKAAANGRTVGLFVAPKPLHETVEGEVKLATESLCRYGLSASRVRAFELVGRHLNKLGNERAKEPEYCFAVLLCQELYSTMQTLSTKALVESKKQGSNVELLKGFSAEFNALLEQLIALPVDEKVTLAKPEEMLPKVNNALNKLYKASALNVVKLCEHFPALKKSKEVGAGHDDTASNNNLTASQVFQ